MTLDAATLEALLPCYLCDDLPPEVAAQVRAAVDADPVLRARLSHMQSSRDACVDALSLVAPDLPPLERLIPAPVRPASSGWRGLVVGLAAAASLLVAASAGRPPAGEEHALLAVHARAVAQPTDFLAETSPMVLRAALLDAGVAPSTAMVPDMSDLGYALVGGMIAPGPRLGVVLVYEKDGKEYACQIYGNFQTSRSPVETRRVAGVTLRGYRATGMAVVSWTSNGRTCLFSGAVPMDDLMATVARRLGGHA